MVQFENFELKLLNSPTSTKTSFMLSCQRWETGILRFLCGGPWVVEVLFLGLLSFNFGAWKGGSQSFKFGGHQTFKTCKWWKIAGLKSTDLICEIQKVFRKSLFARNHKRSTNFTSPIGAMWCKLRYQWPLSPNQPEIGWENAKSEAGDPVIYW